MIDLRRQLGTTARGFVQAPRNAESLSERMRRQKFRGSSRNVGELVGSFSLMLYSSGRKGLVTPQRSE